MVTAKTLAKLETPTDWANERDFRLQLVQLLRARSWRVSFSQPSRPGRRAGRQFMTMGTPGFPDLTCLRPPELVYLELKFYGKAPEPEQRVWLNGLAEVGGNVRAWCVDPGAWPLLVTLARDGIVAVEKLSEPDTEEQA